MPQARRTPLAALLRRLRTPALIALLVVGGLAGAARAQQDERFRTHMPLIANGPVRVMPLGDSITEGVNGGYRVGLWEQAKADGLRINFVGTRSDRWAKLPDKDHEGHPGFTVRDLAREIDGYLAAARPDVVLLMAGTNDLAWYHTEGVAATAARLGALIDRIHAAAPQAHVIVGSIGPMKGRNQQGADRNALATSYNALVRLEVERRAAAGRAVAFVDVNAALTTADLYDDVHPGEAGHAKIAPVWYAALRPLLR
jgi:lysophospholipase L1-like esterase